MTQELPDLSINKHYPGPHLIIIILPYLLNSEKSYCKGRFKKQERVALQERKESSFYKKWQASVSDNA